MEQHWTHHAYTNHHAKDPDKLSAEPMVIFNDYPLQHPKRQWYHRLQSIFVLPILSMYWLSVVFNTEVVDLKHTGATSVGMNFDNDFCQARRKFAILNRLIYMAVTLVPPYLYHDATTASLHLFTMGAFGSALISTLFVLSHNFDGTDRDPTSQNSEKVCWYKAQVETSSTYGGFISGCLTGGLNFQVEHHLFPRMSSAWYPTIMPIVKRVCAKHGVKYTYYPWIWQNIGSTLRFIHTSGTGTQYKAQQTEKPTLLLRYSVASVVLGLYYGIGSLALAKGATNDAPYLICLGIMWVLALPTLQVVFNAFLPTMEMNALMTEATDIDLVGRFIVGGFALWKIGSTVALV